MSLFQGRAKFLDLFAVLLLQSGHLVAEGQDEVALAFWNRVGRGCRPVLLPQALDAVAQDRVGVEKECDTPASRWMAWKVIGSPRLSRTFMADSAAGSAERAEEGAHVLDEQVGCFHGGEVSASVEL
ncbi:hypothetical protein [Nonomuraea sp. NPDC049784]|uniref:hypothetical protein n=1 Tax=Nonomuraea sp. NPDC049784 TaxID=3154361 RepID=UPI0033ECDC84